MKKYRAAFAVLFSTFAILAALIIVFAWKPWKTEHEREIKWLRAYVPWAEQIEFAITTGDLESLQSCDERFESDVGEAPERLRGAAGIALDGCRRVQSLGQAEAEEEWHNTSLNAAGAVLESHSRTSIKKRVRSFEPKTRIVLDKQPIVYCWNGEDWGELVDQFGRVSNELLNLQGYAVPQRNRFHLGPTTCAFLEQFFTTQFSPVNSTETVRLTEALIVFAHEAEHLRVPRASEAVVQCYALQRVRALAIREGRSANYANELAGFAWEIVQPKMPDEYRTDRCHDGGPLDLNPDSRLWP